MHRYPGPRRCHRPEVIVLVGLLFVLAAPATRAQPMFLGGETILRQESGLSTSYDILATPQGYTVVSGVAGLQGQVDLEVHGWDADLLNSTLEATLPSSSPTETYLLDDGNGGVFALWREQLLGSPYRFAGRHVPVGGVPREVFELTHQPWVARRGDVIPLAVGPGSGNYLALWRPAVPAGEDPTPSQVRSFDTAGPAGSLSTALGSLPTELDDLSLAPLASGGFLITWSEPTDTGGTMILARFWGQDPNGAFLAGDVRQIASTPRPVLARPVVIAHRDGSYQVVWRSVDENARELILGRRITLPGGPLDSTTTLSDDGLAPHFGRVTLARGPLGRIWAAWTEGPRGQRRVVTRLIDRDGAPHGPTIVISDAFSGAVSDARITLGVDGVALVTWLHEGTRLVGRRLSEFPEGACLPSPTELCLGDGRFRVEVAWTDYDGVDGSGRDTGFSTPESGLFWFFRSTNWELMVKVIDGCAFNGHHWVFAAATTDVAYTLTVTDTLSGDSRNYSNPLGRAASAINDITAFEGCSRGPR